MYLVVFLILIGSLVLIAACGVALGWQLVMLARLKAQQRRLVASEEALNRPDLRQTIIALLEQYDSLDSQRPEAVHRGFGKRADRFEIAYQLRGMMLALVYYRKGSVPASGSRPYLLEVDFGPNAAAKGLQPQSYWVGAQGLESHQLAALTQGVRLMLEASS